MRTDLCVFALFMSWHSGSEISVFQFPVILCRTHNEIFCHLIFFFTNPIVINTSEVNPNQEVLNTLSLRKMKMFTVADFATRVNCKTHTNVKNCLNFNRKGRTTQGGGGWYFFWWCWILFFWNGGAGAGWGSAPHHLEIH